DEYREKRMLYFFAEAVSILGALLFTLSLLMIFIPGVEIPGIAIASFSWVFLVVYITLRTTLTGIEYPDVATEKRFKKKKRAMYCTSLTFVGILRVSNIVVQGIPTDAEKLLDILAPTIITGIFFFILHYVSLKQSYKKNKELRDE